MPKSADLPLPTLSALPPEAKAPMKSILAMSLTQYHNYISNLTNRNFDKIVVGAAAIQPPTPEAKDPRILLLKRSASEPYYPNVFEIPGGKVDSTDLTIKDAVARELKEETGLELTRVLSQLPEFTYSTAKTVWNDDGKEEFIHRHAIQLSFVVLVDRIDFRVNPDEHSMGLWATKDMLADLNITENMRKIVLDALDRDTDTRVQNIFEGKVS